MTRHHSLRRGMGALGIAGALVAAVATPALASTPPGSGAPSVDLEALVAAAVEEGQVNLIALPPEWANYEGILASFGEKYPDIEYPVQLPDASSADEITAVENQRGSDTMPDALDVSPPVALQSIADGIWDPYIPSTWDEVPEALKDPDGNYIAAYYGIMAISTNTTLVETAPQTFADLRDAPPNSVSLNGDPRQAGAAFAGVFAAALANGGSFDDIKPGIDFFAELNEAGIFDPVALDASTVLSGETEIAIDWSYNVPGIRGQLEEAGFEYSTAFPSDGVYGSYYAQGVVAGGPHPNAARLWIEHLLSDEGALGYLEGGAIPARYEALVANGVITDDMLTNLPPADLIAQVAFPNADQLAAAQATLEEFWGPLVLGE